MVVTGDEKFRWFVIAALFVIWLAVIFALIAK